MGKKRPRVRYSLDAGEVKQLSGREIEAILRGADELISVGGRAMLIKILKGSKDKKVLEYGLEGCPSYGFYHELTMEEISHRVDWMIKEDFLRIEYNGRLPVLVFSEKGWELERKIFADELYQRFCSDAEEKNARVIFEMKNVNRQVVFDVLEKIGQSGNPDLIPLLEAWKSMEVRKVRARIGRTIKKLQSGQEG